MKVNFAAILDISSQIKSTAMRDILLERELKLYGILHVLIS